MSTEKNTQEQPSKDHIIAWYKEQIEVATLRRDLSALQAEIAKNEAQRVQATILMAQMQDPASQNKNEVEHVVTQEDLDANPELVENGLKVGDKILVNNPQPIQAPEPAEEDPKVKKLKND
jgi:uncharacterized small protein (DUF1192 family)